MEVDRSPRVSSGINGSVEKRTNFNASSPKGLNPPPPVTGNYNSQTHYPSSTPNHPIAPLPEPSLNPPIFSLGPFPSHKSRKRPRTKSPSKTDQTVIPVAFNLNQPPPPSPLVTSTHVATPLSSPLPQSVSPDFSSPLDFTSIPETQDIPLPFTPNQPPPNTQPVQEPIPFNQPPDPLSVPLPNSPNPLSQPLPVSPSSKQQTASFQPECFQPIDPKETELEIEATLNIASYLGIELGNHVQQITKEIQGEADLSKRQ